jgi:hypothetical protein
MAGYLKDSFTDKKVGICQRGAKLLPKLTGAHEMISTIMERLDVKIHTGIDYNENCDLAKEYDFVIDCRGYQFIGPRKYFKGEMEGCLNKKNG